MYQKILEERGVADNYLRDATIKDITVNSFKRGYNTRNLGEEIYKDITGQNNNYAYYDELLKSKDYNFQPGNWLEKTVSNASEFLGGQAHQWTDPDAVGAGLGAAGGVLLAGQAGPQAALPEEILTAPAAYLATNFAFQTKKAFEVEAGLAYREMLENGIDENIARNIALGVGGINGLLEAVQINDLVKSFKILDASDLTKPFVKKLYNYIAKRFGNATAETVVEMAQEGVTMGGVNLGGKIDKGESVYGKDEINDRLKDTAESTFGSYMLLGGAGDGIANIYNTKMTVRDIYNNVIRNPYDAKALKRVRDMTETERIYAQAGANAEDISVAAGRAAGHEYDGRKELEAYEYGLRQRKAGKGKDLELLIDATEFLDEFEDSGIMEREDIQLKRADEIPDVEYLEKNHSTISKRSPIEIPEDANYVIQEKNGYNQIKYTWESEGYIYTSRWHTRTPNAPENQGISWVVERRIPGIGNGENHRGRQIEILVGENEWISWEVWHEAIKAQQKGTATKQQKEWLDNGHWKDE